jgi:molybdopterin synthase sulfur carrier subunit
MITIVYFAQVRERLGLEREELPWGAELSDVSALLALLSSRGAIWSEVLQTENLLVAVNQEMADRGLELQDGDEVAFFPPVTGG